MNAESIYIRYLWAVAQLRAISGDFSEGGDQRFQAQLDLCKQLKLQVWERQFS